MRLIFALCFIIGATANSQAQIVVTAYPDTNQIRNQLQGGGIQIYNLSLFADSLSYGLFQGNSELPITNGFALTTGNVLDMSGHSDSVFADTVLGHNNFTGWSETVEVDSLAVYDYGRLSFSVIPVGDTLLLGYCFASEEYLRCNDVGAIMITGPNPAGGNYDSLRVSWVGTPNFPLCVVNCSPLAWQQYYVPYWTIPAQYESYRGGTVYFQWEIAVVPNQPYYLSLSVADAFDGNYDSALLIEKIWSDSTVSVSEHSDNSTCLFPNPANTELTFQFDHADESRSVVIYNSAGQVVETYSTNKNTLLISTTAIAEGLYFYQMFTSDSKPYAGKFVVVH